MAHVYLITYHNIFYASVPEREVALSWDDAMRRKRELETQTESPVAVWEVPLVGAESAIERAYKAYKASKSSET